MNNEKAPIPEDLRGEFEGKLGRFFITGGRHLRYNTTDQSDLKELFRPFIERIAALQAEVAQEHKQYILKMDGQANRIHDLEAALVAKTAEVDALKAEAKMRTDQLDSTLETADREWEADEAVYQERDALKAEVARLSAPVSDAEVAEYGLMIQPVGEDTSGLYFEKETIEEMLAARATPHDQKGVE